MLGLVTDQLTDLPPWRAVSSNAPIKPLENRGPGSWEQSPHGGRVGFAPVSLNCHIGELRGGRGPSSCRDREWFRLIFTAILISCGMTAAEFTLGWLAG